MGKYHSQVRRRSARTAEGPHPIWNSLGCIMMIVVPVMSIAGAKATIDYGLSRGWPVPPELLRRIVLPNLIYKLPGLAAILEKIVSVQNIAAYAVLSLLYIVVLGAVISLIYAFIYRATGPSRYGPLDMPPEKIKAAKRSR
ncbi:MAG: hypothetical protein ACM3QS_00275 [Bacteroidota bacterium]